MRSLDPVSPCPSDFEIEAYSETVRKTGPWSEREREAAKDGRQGRADSLCTYG
jgi:hypothetical protein